MITYFAPWGDSGGRAARSPIFAGCHQIDSLIFQTTRRFFFRQDGATAHRSNGNGLGRPPMAVSEAKPALGQRQKKKEKSAGQHSAYRDDAPAPAPRAPRGVASHLGPRFGGSAHPPMDPGLEAPTRHDVPAPASTLLKTHKKCDFIERHRRLHGRKIVGPGKADGRSAPCLVLVNITTDCTVWRRHQPSVHAREINDRPAKMNCIRPPAAIPGPAQALTAHLQWARLLWVYADN